MYVGATVGTLVVLLIALQAMLEVKTTAQAIQAGVYQVDALWPKPLPNHWVFGSVVGLAVDSRDHVWVVHRGKASMDPDLGAMMSLSARAPRFGGGVAPSNASPSPSSVASRRRRSLSSTPRETWSGTGARRAQGYEWPPSMHGITLDGKDNVWLAGNNGNTVLKFREMGSSFCRSARMVRARAIPIGSTSTTLPK